MSVKPKLGPMKCIPSLPGARCQFCTRYATSRPREMNHGFDLVVMDVTAVMPAQDCSFYIGGPKHKAAMFAPKHRVMFDATQIGGAA